MKLFTNCTVFKLTKPLTHTIEELTAAMADFAFQPCGAQDVRKYGWIPPLQALGGEELVMTAEGNILFSLKSEEKILPAASVRKATAVKVKAMEEEENRKLTKKEKDAVKDMVTQELLPRALTKETVLNAVLIQSESLFVIDTATHSKAEELCAMLRKCLGSLPVLPLAPFKDPRQIMSDWLKANVNDLFGFKVGNDARLESWNEDRAVITLKNDDLFGDEVKAHLESKQVVSIALVTQNAAFTLTNGLQVKSIKWDEMFKCKNDDIDHEDKLARADADFVLMTSELKNMLVNIQSAMGIAQDEEEAA